MERQTKVFKPQAMKMGGDAGEFMAVFATLNTVDHDGDRILNGAIGNQNVIISAYGHGSWMGELPVGKGRIFEDGNDAIIEGRFFIDTEKGKETYLTVKNVAELQEWSFALPEMDWQMVEEDGSHIREIKRVKVNEISPVLMGAGIATRTLSIKGREADTMGQKPDESITFAKHLDEAVETVERVLARAKEIRNLRDEQGKGLSKAAVRRLKALQDALHDASTEISALLTNPNDELKELAAQIQGGHKDGA